MAEIQLAEQILPIAFTTTSIYVVFIVFLLDRYVDLKDRGKKAAGVILLGGSLIVFSFAFTTIATLTLFMIVLGNLPDCFAIYASYVLGLGILILTFGTIALGVGLMVKDLPNVRRLL